MTSLGGGYNQNISLLPSTGGTIQAMSGGGIGTPPVGYIDNSLLERGSGPIHAFSGGDPSAEAAVAATVVSLLPPTVPTPTTPATTPTTTPITTTPTIPISSSDPIMNTMKSAAVAAALSNPSPTIRNTISSPSPTIRNTISNPPKTESVNESKEPITNKDLSVQSEKSNSIIIKNTSKNGTKDILIFGEMVKLKNPSKNTTNSFTEGQKKALELFGLDGDALDIYQKREVLQALYDEKCTTDKSLILLDRCEPIRKIIEILALNLLQTVQPKPTSILKALQSNDEKDIDIERLENGSNRVCITYKGDKVANITTGGPKDQKGGPKDQKGGPKDQKGGPKDQKGEPEDQKGGPEDQKEGQEVTGKNSKNSKNSKICSNETQEITYDTYMEKMSFECSSSEQTDSDSIKKDIFNKMGLSLSSMRQDMQNSLQSIRNDRTTGQICKKDKLDEWISCKNKCETTAKQYIDKEIKSTAYILRTITHSILPIEDNPPNNKIIFTINCNLSQLTGIWKQDKQYISIKQYGNHTEIKTPKLVMGFGPSASGKTRLSSIILNLLKKVNGDSFPDSFISIDGGLYREASMTYSAIICIARDYVCSAGFDNLVIAGISLFKSLFESDRIKKIITEFLQTQAQSVSISLYVPETLGGCILPSCQGKYQKYIDITKDKEWIGLLIWQHKEGKDCPLPKQYTCKGCTESGKSREKDEGKKYSNSAWGNSMSQGEKEMLKAPGGRFKIHNGGRSGFTSIIEDHSDYIPDSTSTIFKENQDSFDVKYLYINSDIRKTIIPDYIEKLDNITSNSEQLDTLDKNSSNYTQTISRIKANYDELRQMKIDKNDPYHIYLGLYPTEMYEINNKIEYLDKSYQQFVKNPSLWAQINDTITLTVYYVRHMYSCANYEKQEKKSKLFWTLSDPSLHCVGLKQAELLGEDFNKSNIPIDRICTSQMLRAIQTGLIIRSKLQNTKLPFQVIPHINEKGFTPDNTPSKIEKITAVQEKNLAIQIDKNTSDKTNFKKYEDNILPTIFRNLQETTSKNDYNIIVVSHATLLDSIFNKQLANGQIIKVTYTFTSDGFLLKRDIETEEEHKQIEQILPSPYQIQPRVVKHDRFKTPKMYEYAKDCTICETAQAVTSNTILDVLLPERLVKYSKDVTIKDRSDKFGIEQISLSQLPQKYTLTESDKYFTLRGIKNPNIYCYCISTIQLLFSIPEFRSAILNYSCDKKTNLDDKLDEKEESDQVDTKGILCALKQLFTQLSTHTSSFEIENWNTFNTSTLFIKDQIYIDYIQYIMKNFIKTSQGQQINRQQDASDFLRFMFESILKKDETLNRIVPLFQNDEQKYYSCNTELDLDTDYDKLEKMNKPQNASEIINLYLQKYIESPSSSSSSNDSNGIPLDKLIKSYSSIERDTSLDICDNKSGLLSTYIIPNPDNKYIIFHTNKAIQFSVEGQKAPQIIPVPIGVKINVTPTITIPTGPKIDDENIQYTLFSSILYTGTENGTSGHYRYERFYPYHNETRSTLYDDSKVTFRDLNTSDVDQSSFLLIYKRVLSQQEQNTNIQNAIAASKRAEEEAKRAEEEAKRAEDEAKRVEEEAKRAEEEEKEAKQMAIAAAAIAAKEIKNQKAAANAKRAEEEVIAATREKERIRLEKDEADAQAERLRVEAERLRLEAEEIAVQAERLRLESEEKAAQDERLRLESEAAVEVEPDVEVEPEVDVEVEPEVDVEVEPEVDVEVEPEVDVEVEPEVDVEVEPEVDVEVEPEVEPEVERLQLEVNKTKNKMKKNSNIASSVGLITSGVANIGSSVSTLTALEKYKKNKPVLNLPYQMPDDGKYNDNSEGEEEEPIFSSSSSPSNTPNTPISTNIRNVPKRSWRNIVGENTQSSILSPSVSLKKAKSSNSVTLPVNTSLSNTTKRNSRYPLGLSEPLKNITLKNKKNKNKISRKTNIQPNRNNSKRIQRVTKNILSPLESNTTYKRPQGKKRSIDPNKQRINRLYRNTEKNAERQLQEKLEKAKQNKQKAKENKTRLFKEKQAIAEAERKRQEEEVAERKRQEEEEDRIRQEKALLEEQLREIVTTVQKRSSDIQLMLEKAEEEKNNTERQKLMNSATMIAQSSKAKASEASKLANKYPSSKNIQGMLQNIQTTTNIANDQIKQTRRKLGEKVGKLVNKYELLAQQQLPKIKKGGQNTTKTSNVSRTKQNTRKLRK